VAAPRQAAADQHQDLPLPVGPAPAVRGASGRIARLAPGERLQARRTAALRGGPLRPPRGPV